MSALIVVIFVVAVLVLLTLTALGFRPAPPLSEFRPNAGSLVRRFADTPDRVLAAYTTAAARTPGMRVVEHRNGLLYLDSRPTARILAGDFGMALRLRVSGDGNNAVVSIEGQGKAFGIVRPASLRELERALRMRAKTSGITERIS